MKKTGRLTAETTQGGARQPAQNSPLVSHTSTDRKPLPFVLDMFFMKTPDEREPRKLTPIPLDRQACRKIHSALCKASDNSSFIVPLPFRTRSGWGYVQTRFRVSVGVSNQPEATKNFSAFTLRIEMVGTPGSQTRITVKFTRDFVKKPTRFAMSLQGNPATLFTGQNTWPVEPFLESHRHELAYLFGLPFLVLMAVCKQADFEFVEPPALRKAMLGGRGIVQNAQFAINVNVPAAKKQVTLALLDAAYSSRRYRTKDGELETFSIGELLRVKSRLYAKRPRDGGGPNNGRESLQTALQRKTSGSHDVFSLSWYDKAVELRLSEQQARTHGLANSLRLDITLQARGLAKLFTDAQRLAKRHRNELPLDRNGAGEVVRSVKNIIDAIVAIDNLYEASINERSVKGFSAWLVCEVVGGEFHLRELFGQSESERSSLAIYFEKLGQNSERFAKAFGDWCKVEFTGRSLRDCMIKAGINEKTVDRHMKKIRERGVSGLVPPTYWRNREALWLNMGASDADLDKYTRRLKVGKSVLKILGRSQTTMAQAFQGIVSAIESGADQANVRTAAIPRRRCLFMPSVLENADPAGSVQFNIPGLMSKKVSVTTRAAR